MPTVTTIGSALLDVFITSDAFTINDVDQAVLTRPSQGGKLVVDGFQLHTGGGGSNTAVGFARMGFAAHCISELGRDDTAYLVLEDLRRENVSTDFLIQERKEQSGGSVILVSESGERMVLVHRGAASMLDPSDVFEEVFERSDWIHLSSLSGRVDTVRHIFSLVQANQVRMSWNPGKSALEQIAKGELDCDSLPVQVLILNKEEWQIIAERQEQLASRIPHIVVTDGSRGGVYKHQGTSTEYQAESLAAVDETGAGDAFCVGFVSALLHNKTPQDGIEWGKRNAASVVQQLGAKPGLLRHSQFQH